MVSDMTDQKTLEQQLYDGEISRLEYINGLDQEHIDAFKAFCRHFMLPEDAESAEKFFDHLLLQEEKAHTEGLD
jgi:hypothetical protein